MTLAATDTSLEPDIRIADPRWVEALGDVDRLCAQALTCASTRMQRGGDVSILFTDDAEMQGLNRAWRKLDKPTDVLSFPYSGPRLSGPSQPLGDIALGFETALRDAQAMDRQMTFHVSHLLVHGFLHLLGYDHIGTGDAAVMEKLEVAILADLGWPDPYDSRYDGET